MRTVLIFLLSTILLVSCDENLVDSQTVSFKNAKWAIENSATFDFKAPDTLNNYDLFFNLRNTHEYQYSNLFLIAQMKFPQGKIVTDTLEYDMAFPNGEFIGTARGNVYENKLWYKEEFRFRESGIYTISLRHAMRKNGTVNGIARLDGVLDIGYSIEKPVQHGNN